MMFKLLFSSLLVWTAWYSVAYPQQDLTPQIDEALADFRLQLEAAIADGHIVGAQCIVGTQKQQLLNQCLGVMSPESGEPIEDSTRFCIGSCSKSWASAIALSLVGDAQLQLDEPVSNWLPKFGSVKLESGLPVQRAPTLRELLCHRGGIYSQRNPLSSNQKKYIRDFELSLEESADGIASEPLDNQPGSVYAYSGAGYCIVGRMIEVASMTTLEKELQRVLCQPLNLSNTSFFPTRSREGTIAIGFSGKGLTLAPHLHGDKHRFPLPGGSLYSTASDMSQFAKLMLGEGEYEGKHVLPREQWEEMTRVQFNGQSYGLGWSLITKAVSEADPDKVVGLRHAGSLSSYRSFTLVDLEHGLYAIANLTVSRANYDVRLLQKALQVGMQQFAKQ